MPVKSYKCALCHLEFEAEDPQALTHPNDLKLVGVTPEEAARYTPVVCAECLKTESGELVNTQELGS